MKLILGTVYMSYHGVMMCVKFLENGISLRVISLRSLFVHSELELSNQQLEFH